MRQPPNAGALALDLTPLACGSRQHVFVPTGCPASEWVYKLPSAAPITEQYGAELREYRPTSRVATLIYRAFVQLPNEYHDRSIATLVARGASEVRIRAVAARHRTICETRGRSLAGAYRWTRRRHFRRMLAVAGQLERDGFLEVMLPFRIERDAVATLRLPGGDEDYYGPILVQQRADFFDRSGRFDEFDWDDVITTQHRLWAHGFGLTDTNEILGPKNWGLVDGHLRLADLSSLTRSRRAARALLDPAFLDEREGRVVRRLQREGNDDALALAGRYFAHVRSAINVPAFDRLWSRSRTA
jgi:hypothetical protein